MFKSIFRGLYTKIEIQVEFHIYCSRFDFATQIIYCFYVDDTIKCTARKKSTKSVTNNVLRDPYITSIKPKTHYELTFEYICMWFVWVPRGFSAPNDDDDDAPRAEVHFGHTHLIKCRQSCRASSHQSSVRLMWCVNRYQQRDAKEFYFRARHTSCACFSSVVGYVEAFFVYCVWPCWPECRFVFGWLFLRYDITKLAMRVRLPIHIERILLPNLMVFLAAQT